VTEVVASGGGVHNPALMEALRGRLEGAALVTSDDRGIPADGKDVVLWALLGFLTWHGVPGNMIGTTGATGATHPRILGRITPGLEPLRLPKPAVWPPRRLVLDPGNGA
jgi:anhydro-N-acetylmuramic acid kinase